jgi:very-short-patch-repair endonuclease
MKRHIETRTRAKTLRANLTEPERRLWYRIRANRLGVKFQRQVVLPPYIADFACRSRRLVVEVDGDTHGGREAYDAARTRALAEMGYRMIRVTNAEVMTNLDGVLQAILLALKSPHPVQGERASRGEAEAGRGRGSKSPLSLRR